MVNNNIMSIKKNMEKLANPQITLLGPGPSNVHPRVLQALALGPISHLDPYLLKIYAQEQEMLRTIFNTRNQWTFALSGTGTSGMEASLANLLEPGDGLLVGVNGYFGSRLAEIGGRLGALVRTIEIPPGEIFQVETIEQALTDQPVKVFSMVHAETSTGVEQLRIQEISRVVHDHNALFILDTVTSLGGIPVAVDEWDVDICYSASQKNLSAPSGLAPITISERARQVINHRKNKVPSFYLDLPSYFNYWNENHAYHHTASSHLHFALHEALTLIFEEGLPERFNRLNTNAARLWSGLEHLGIQPFIPFEFRLPVLTTAIVPENMDGQATRARLYQERNIEIASGLGALKDKLWRIGLMGYSSSQENISALLDGLKAILG